MKASYEVFSRKGFSEATLEEIAELADIGKGTLYGHFESKMHLIAYLVRHSVDEIINFIESQVKGSKNFSEFLSSVVSAHISFFTQNVGIYKLLFYARALVKQEEQDPLVREIRTELNRYLTFLAKSFNGDMGSFHPLVPPADLAVALAGAIDGFFSYWLIEGLKAEEIDKKAGVLANIILKGLQEEKGP